MSGVIKQRDVRAADRIRPVRQETIGRQERIDPFAARLAIAEAEVERLQTALLDRETEVARLQAAARESFAEGREEGLAEGQKIGEERRAAALEQLEIALSVAGEQLADSLQGLEMLAPLVARTGLERVLGDPGERTQLVADALRHQLALVDHASLVQAEVSPEDFPDAADLETLPGRLGAPRLKILPKDDLAAGEARLRLLLGGLEVGPAQQMKVLASLLENLAAEGGE